MPKACTQLRISGISSRAALRPLLGHGVSFFPRLRSASILSCNSSAISMNSRRRILATSLAGTWRQALTDNEGLVLRLLAPLDSCLRIATSRARADLAGTRVLRCRCCLGQGTRAFIAGDDRQAEALHRFGVGQPVAPAMGGGGGRQPVTSLSPLPLA